MMNTELEILTIFSEALTKNDDLAWNSLADLLEENGLQEAANKVRVSKLSLEIPVKVPNIAWDHTLRKRYEVPPFDDRVVTIDVEKVVKWMVAKASRRSTKKTSTLNYAIKIAPKKYPKKRKKRVKNELV